MLSACMSGCVNALNFMIGEIVNLVYTHIVRAIISCTPISCVRANLVSTHTVRANLVRTHIMLANPVRTHIVCARANLVRTCMYCAR